MLSLLSIIYQCFILHFNFDRSNNSSFHYVTIKLFLEYTYWFTDTRYQSPLSMGNKSSVWSKLGNVLSHLFYLSAREHYVRQVNVFCVVWTLSELKYLRSGFRYDPWKLKRVKSRQKNYNYLSLRLCLVSHLLRTVYSKPSPLNFPTIQNVL